MVVLPSSDHSEWPSGAVVNGIDRFTVAHDLTHGAARVPQEHMTIPIGARETLLEIFEICHDMSSDLLNVVHYQ